MIKLYEMTPKVYYEHSRDFQFIGRLYDLVLNAVKTNSDLIYNIPINDNSDEKLTDLMAMTLGFKSLHNYNLLQLKALCGCFAKIIRNKGNIQSIQDACNALCGAEGIKEKIYVDYTAANNGALVIYYIPQELHDQNLLKDLLLYILPAGVSCKIIKTFKKTANGTTEIIASDKVNKNIRPGISTSVVVSKLTNGKIVDKNRPFNEVGAFVNTTVVVKAAPSTDSDNKETNK